MVGLPLPTEPAARPEPCELNGRFVSLVGLDPAAHASSLFDASHGPGAANLWDYLSEGPFADHATFEASLQKKSQSADPMFLAIVDQATGDAVGYASYMRIEPAHRVIEVGNILYTPRVQRTPGATEAMYLMARHAFETLGYRRYEWKCHAQNARSRQAALRLGFTFEGIFRQHMIVKGRSRDTAWYSMLDGEWPRCRAALEAWLAPDNFDAEGRQQRRLADIRSSCL